MLAQKKNTLAERPNLAGIRALVFDLDGTLIDSMNSFSEIAQNVMQKYFGVAPPAAAEMYKRTSGYPFQFQLQTLFPNHPALMVAAQEFETTKVSVYEGKPFYLDVTRALPLFKQLGFKLCISSNNHFENVQKKAVLFPFDRVLGYREGFFKGHDHFELIKSEFNLRADEILFVGDSLNDARAAHENGIAFVARLGTFSAQDFNQLDIPMCHIQNFFELIQLLQDKAA